MTITITTLVAHGLEVGNVVSFEDIIWDLDGNSEQPDQLNGGTYCVDSVPSPTTYTITECGYANKVAIHNQKDDTLTIWATDGTDWTQVGNGGPLVTTGIYGDLASLTFAAWDADQTTLRVAWIDESVSRGGSGELTTFEFNGTNWSQIGNAFDYTASVEDFTFMTAMTATRIMVYVGSFAEARVYDFDGTDWARVGVDLEVPADGTPRLGFVSAMTSSRVAYVNTSLGRLRAMDFDGNDWAQVGNFLSYTGDNDALGYVEALSSTRIILMVSAAKLLRTFDFDGADWTEVGTGTTLTDTDIERATPLSSNRIAMVGMNAAQTHSHLTIYDFDGANWVQVGNRTVVSTQVTSVHSSIATFPGSGDAVDTTGWTDYDSDGSAFEQVSTISGLDHLEGESVVGLANGIPFTGTTVSSGAITRQTSKAQVGLEFCHRFQSLKQDVGAPSGSALGKPKRIGNMTVSLLWAADFTYGDDLLDTMFASDNDNTNVHTGERYLEMDSGWSSDERFVFKGCEPLPWFCLAVMPEIWTNDLK